MSQGLRVLVLDIYDAQIRFRGQIGKHLLTSRLTRLTSTQRDLRPLVAFLDAWKWVISCVLSARPIFNGSVSAMGRHNSALTYLCSLRALSRLRVTFARCVRPFS